MIKIPAAVIKELKAEHKQKCEFGVADNVVARIRLTPLTDGRINICGYLMMQNPSRRIHEVPEMTAHCREISHIEYDVRNVCNALARKWADTQAPHTVERKKVNGRLRSAY